MSVIDEGSAKVSLSVLSWSDSSTVLVLIVFRLVPALMRESDNKLDSMSAPSSASRAPVTIAPIRPPSNKPSWPCIDWTMRSSLSAACRQRLLHLDRV